MNFLGHQVCRFLRARTCRFLHARTRLFCARGPVGFARALQRSAMFIDQRLNTLHSVRSAMYG